MTAKTSQPAAASTSDDKVVFLDSFDADTLDRSKWNVEGPAFWVNKEEQA